MDRAIFGVQIVFWKEDSATLNPPSPRVEGKKTREKPGRQVSSAEAYKMRHSYPRTIVLVEKGPLLSNHICSSKLATTSLTVGRRETPTAPPFHFSLCLTKAIQ